MFFLLSKILSFLLSPIWWVVILMLFYVVFHKQRVCKFLLYISIGVLLVFSNQLMFYHVAGCWEGELQSPNKVVPCDGIIVLGGFSSYQSKTHRIRFYESADRLYQAIELFKKGKAQRFIFTGGSGRVVVREKKEGDYLRAYLKLLGIPEESTLIEWKSKNTHENAVETLKMLQSKTIENGNYLLVTSGFHMNRAMACFKKVGINVCPYIADPLQNTLAPDFMDAITPSAIVLASWEKLFREWVGYWVYWLKDYV